jgi:hypothetical protein
MKIILMVVIGLCCGALGFWSGNEYGYHRQRVVAPFMPLHQLKEALAQKEKEIILQLVDVEASVSTKDEGGLFKVKLVTHVEGTISNNASVSTIKDVAIQLVFYSKTKTQVGEATVVVYEYIKPGNTLKFKERINWPEEAETYSARVVGVKTDSEQQ